MCAVAGHAAEPAPLTAVQERGLKPKDSFRECENCPEMVVVPAGRFTMGSPSGEKDRDSDEGPRHVVTIGRPFAVGKFHVTVDQFAVFVEETGRDMSKRLCSWRSPGFAQEGSHPVVCVNWDDANAYVDWIAKKTGKPYRLLSEAEWEYAARGRTSPGTYPRFWFGDDQKDLCRYGNFRDQKAGSAGAPCNDGYDGTSPAGHFAPNAFGLYDMAGNAWQWTADCYGSSYDGAPTDGSAWTTETCELINFYVDTPPPYKLREGSWRVVRGGSWFDYPRTLRAAERTSLIQESYRLGFRLARSVN
jgi:formylglycine-generating enzyme required for sulfatase activity